MKKLIFALLVLAAVPMLAQNSDKYISVGQIPSEQKMINNVTQRTLEALRVIPLNDSTGSTNLYTKQDTSKSTVDTLSFGFTSQGIFVQDDGSSSDTMFVSPVGTFPSNQTIILIGTENFSYPLAWSKLYYKFRTTPVSGKHYRVRAY